MAQQEVKAILTAEDRSYTSTMKKAMSVTESFGSKVKSGIGFGALMKVGSFAISTIGNAMKGLIVEIDSTNAAWKSFKANMEMIGKGGEVAKVQKELQNFAAQTVYSSSDMAQTFSQLEAVGTKNTTALVKGFGMVAAAAENPKQAMKTLSTQATQMAAKPTVMWQDFRLMLEQTPAGIAQVAKEMGKTTTELVKDVQDGKVATEDFFNAIAKAGANKQLQKMATTYKTMGQAADGLQETVANKLAPAWDKASQVGIKAMTRLIDSMDGLDLGKYLNTTSFTEGLNLLLDDIGVKAQQMIPKGVEFVTNLLKGMSQNLPSILQHGTNMVLNLIMGIAKALPQLIVTGLNTLTKFVQGLGQGNPALVSKALDIVKTLALGLIKAAPQILAAGVQLIFALIQGITRQFAVIPGKVASLARKIPSAIKSGVGNLAGIGRNLIEGLWGGIKSKFDSVVARVKALAAKLPKAVKKVLGIGSPSRVMNRQVGRWIPAGLAQGITQNTRLVTDAMQNLVSIPNSAMGYAMASEYEYGVSARYEVIVPVELNGREIARATASDMQTALNQREMRANRKVGVR